MGEPASHRWGSDPSTVACDSVPNREGTHHPLTPLPISLLFRKAPGKAPEKEEAWPGAFSTPCLCPLTRSSLSAVFVALTPPGHWSLSHHNSPYSLLPRGPGLGRLRAGPKLPGTHPRRTWPGPPSASDLAISPPSDPRPSPGDSRVEGPERGPGSVLSSFWLSSPLALNMDMGTGTCPSP